MIRRSPGGARGTGCTAGSSSGVRRQGAGTATGISSGLRGVLPSPPGLLGGLPGLAWPAWRRVECRMSNKILEYSTDAQITQPWNISIWNIPQIRFERNCGMFHRCIICNTVEYSTNESVEYSIVVQNAKLWNQ